MNGMGKKKQLYNILSIKKKKRHGRRNAKCLEINSKSVRNKSRDLDNNNNNIIITYYIDSLYIYFYK